MEHSRGSRRGGAIRIVMLCLFITAPCTPAGSAAGQWKVLFDGQSLDGWANPYDWGKAWVESGEIRLQADKKFFLVTSKTYRDFIFEAEIKMPEGTSNSGVMFRCHQKPNRVWGYQAEVDPSDRQWSGGLYDEGRRGWLHPRSNDPAAAQAFVAKTKGAFKRDGWNLYRVHCVGSSIRIYVNGVLTTDFMDTTDRAGYMAIQHHGEKGKIYRFRNIRVKELEAPATLQETVNNLPVAFYEDFESGADRWMQTDPNAWWMASDGGSQVFALHKQSIYEPPVRSPVNIARIEDLSVGDFVLQAKMRQAGREYGHRDMCVFFGYQDPSHFYYAHIASAADEVAHTIHIVNGAPRTAIAQERTKGVDWGTGYHDVRVIRDTATGSIEVFFDDMDKPIMRAVDKTFLSGGVGFGSFDDTGNIDEVIVWGK